MNNELRFREQEIQISRYRRLERDVTDPLALCLLHWIIAELEADLPAIVTVTDAHTDDLKCPLLVRKRTEVELAAHVSK